MDRVDRIAAALADDWRARAPYRTLAGDDAPSDVAEAYAVQTALHKKLGAERGPVAGRKIALSSKAMQAMVGLDHPVAGAIFSKDVRRSTKTEPAAVPLDGFRRLGVEFELAFTMKSEIAPQSGRDAASVKALIAEARPAFELIEDRGADYAALDALTLIADNAWCGGVVLGEPISNWETLDLSNQSATVHQSAVDPEPANTGAADPMASLAWVLNHAGALGQTIAAGEVVITGSVVRTRFPKQGDTLRYVIGDAEAALTIV